MSDSKLRELERRWRETKSVEDETAYLRERVRVGDLTQERLELAGLWGHAAARVATSRSIQDSDLAGTVAAAVSRSKTLTHLHCVMAFEGLLEMAPVDESARAALKHVKSFLSQPSPAAAMLVRSAAESAKQSALDTYLRRLPDDDGAGCAAAAFLARAIDDPADLVEAIKAAESAAGIAGCLPAWEAAVRGRVIASLLHLTASS